MYFAKMTRPTFRTNITACGGGGVVFQEEVMRQEVPRCPACKQGVVKPDITFFGEKLPSSVKRAVEADHKKVETSGCFFLG